MPKTQEQINAEWLVSYPTNSGTITRLTPPLKVVPGLRKPYQYELSAEKIARLRKALRDTINPSKPTLHCQVVEFKGLTLGVRLHVFLLGYAPGFYGCQGGMTAEQWEACVAAVRSCLTDALGPDIPLYVEPWQAKDKFQARYETYIKRAGL